MRTRRAQAKLKTCSFDVTIRHYISLHTYIHIRIHIHTHTQREEDRERERERYWDTTHTLTYIFLQTGFTQSRTLRITHAQNRHIYFSPIHFNARKFMVNKNRKKLINTITIQSVPTSIVHLCPSALWSSL